MIARLAIALLIGLLGFFGACGWEYLRAKQRRQRKEAKGLALVGA